MKMQIEINKCQRSPICTGSETEICECVKALQDMEPDTIDELREEVVAEIKTRIPEVRNILGDEKTTQQKRAEHAAAEESSQIQHLATVVHQIVPLIVGKVYGMTHSHTRPKFNI